jgi:hypothetical protein
MNFGIETISLIITIILALIGYLITYLNNLALTRRAERLQLITSQINELYGPMYIITTTGKVLFDALRSKGSFQGFISENNPESNGNISEWQIWLETVFMPMNENLERVIIEKSHLIREYEMPLCLQAFIAHNAGYKAVLAKWKIGNFSESTSVIPFPQEIYEYAKVSYQELKKEQLKIIALSAKPKVKSK